MATMKIEGLEELQKQLRENADMNDVKRIVQQNGAELQRKIQSKADFKKGYQTGTTKRSVGLEFKDGGLTAESGPETQYAPYLEYGTRFMEAQPFVKPALDEQSQQFKKDLQKLVK